MMKQIVIKEFFDSLKNRYQINLKSMKSSEFVFNYAHLLYHKCHKINPNCGGLYIDSPYWIKNKKSNNRSRQQKRQEMFSICYNSRIES